MGNDKYKGYSDISARETFCQAPLLFLCILFGILPSLLLDWMQPSVANLVTMLKAAGGQG